jgi:hypothetical protein
VVEDGSCWMVGEGLIGCLTIVPIGRCFGLGRWVGWGHSMRLALHSYNLYRFVLSSS